MTNMPLSKKMKLGVYGAITMVTGIAIGMGLNLKTEKDITIDITSELAVDPYIERMMVVGPDSTMGYHKLDTMVAGKSIAWLETDLKKHGFSEEPHEQFLTVPQVRFSYTKTIRFGALCQTFVLITTSKESQEAFEKGDTNFKVSKQQGADELIGLINQSGCF